MSKKSTVRCSAFPRSILSGERDVISERTKNFKNPRKYITSSVSTSPHLNNVVGSAMAEVANSSSFDLYGIPGDPFMGMDLLSMVYKAIKRNFADVEENIGYVIEKYRDQQPDVVFCDLRMSGMDGFEVIKIIATEAPNTPLIVVSGAGLLEDAIDALRMGAWDYVSKPIYDMVEVEHIVNKALEKAALLAENRQYQIRMQSLLQEQTREFNKSQNLLETISVILLTLMKTPISLVFLFSFYQTNLLHLRSKTYKLW